MSTPGDSGDGAAPEGAQPVVPSPGPPERPASELAASARVIVRRSIGSPILFTIVYSSLASAIYFSLGVIAGHALGLTPLVFLISAVLFTLTAMTYVEGASLHQERGGSTVFARYAFNELVSFVAGWAILLDYVILIAVTAYSATQYLQVFWSRLGQRDEALGLALAFIALVVLGNIRGFGTRRARRVGMLLAGDIAVQAFIVVLGLILFFEPGKWLDAIHLGSAPKWSDLIFALTVAVIAFTSLESASGLSGEVRISRAGLKRLVWSTTGTVVFLYVGIALVAVTALPVHDGHTALGGRYLDAPMIGIVKQVHPHWLEQTLRYLVAALAPVTLLAAANSAMLGLSRLAYSLSTNRQIPSGLGRLHPERSTPYVLIILAGLIAAGLVVPENLDFLIGIYAFGAMLAFTIAHLSIMPPALQRARPRPALQDPPVDQLQRRRAAAPGGLRRAGLRSRLADRDGRPRTRPLRRPRLDGRSGWRCTSSTAAPTKPRCCAASPSPRRCCAPSSPASATTARCWCPCSGPTSTMTSCRPPRCSSPASRPTRPRSTRPRSRRCGSS